VKDASEWELQVVNYPEAQSYKPEPDGIRMSVAFDEIAFLVVQSDVKKRNVPSIQIRLINSDGCFAEVKLDLCAICHLFYNRINDTNILCNPSDGQWQFCGRLT
jgi:hypothetical protein